MTAYDNIMLTQSNTKPDKRIRGNIRQMVNDVYQMLPEVNAIMAVYLFGRWAKLLGNDFPKSVIKATT